MRHYLVQVSFLAILAVPSAVTARQLLPTKQQSTNSTRDFLASSLRPDFRLAKAPAWRPTHEAEYEFEDNEWSFVADYNYSYDTSGNTLSKEVSSPWAKSRVDYTYDTDGNVTQQLTSFYDEESGKMLPYQRIDMTYDRTTATVTGKQTWLHDGEAWYQDFDNVDNNFKYDIERDTTGNVVSVTKSVVDPYDTESGYKTIERQSFSYDKATGLPIAYELYEASDESFTLALTEQWKNMKWEKFNGQLVDFFGPSWFSADNFLKSADNGTSHILAQQLDKGGFMTKLTDTDHPEQATIIAIEYDANDGNGSYKYYNNYYKNADGKEPTDADLCTSSAEIYKFDSHGNLTLYEGWGNLNDYGEVLLQEGTRNEYTYGGPNGELTQTVTSEFAYGDTDYALTKKVTADKFANVATSISGVQPSADAPGSVYNLQGKGVGNSLQGLPHGIYIIKRNGKYVKVSK